jgi:hypothetical protein
MTTMNVEQVVTAVREWAAARNAQFKYYWPVKGGWEGWVQVDLTAFILAHDSTEEILREQPIFPNARQRVDLLINADQRPAQQVGVEIKAQSFDNAGRFIAGVDDDLAKLENVDDAYHASTRVMVAIAFNQATLDELLGIEKDRHRVFWTVYTGEVAVAIAIRTGDDWLNPYVKQESMAARSQPGASTSGFGTPADFGAEATFPALAGQFEPASLQAGR